MKQAYGSWGYREDEDAEGKPSCGPKQFKELTGATCIDPHSGVCCGGGAKGSPSEV
jgi:hypothetical protein